MDTRTIRRRAFASQTLRRQTGLVAAALACTSMLSLAASSSSAPIGRIPADSFVRSDTCGECHRDIYAAWRQSAHARSMEAPAFLESFRTLEVQDPALARVCLECHAPLARHGGDPTLSRKVTWEGVTCDFCHTMRSVAAEDSRFRYEVTMGTVKRGPVRDAESTAHDVAYSELHMQSLVCAPCHEYANDAGIPVLTTYTEWRQSEAAASGVTCQACHMPEVEGNVVDPRIQRDPRALVNTHAMTGGHSLAMLHKALRVGIHPEREEETLRLTVEIENKGAGHAVPTGMPGRRVILEVVLHVFEGPAYTERKVYGKRFLDAEGHEIVAVADYFRPGSRQVEDTRLRPDELRREVFLFPVPKARPATVTLKLDYEHPLGPGAAEPARFTFFSETRIVPSRP